MSELRLSFASKKLAGPTGVTVWLPDPPQGEAAQDFYPGKKHKVLWLLHVGCGDGGDWARYTNLPALLAGRRVIAVMPDGLNSDFANHPEFGDGYLFADYFFEELMPFVHHCLPASAMPQDNFLGGVSMGSLGTWTLALTHPERFGGIAPLSGLPRDYAYLEPHRTLDASAFRRLAEADPQAFPAGYGNPKHGIWPKEINMICKYPTVGGYLDSTEHHLPLFQKVAAQGNMPKVYMVGGEKDAKLSAFQARVKDLGVEARFDLTPDGGHGYPFWGRFLPDMMEYFGIAS